MVAIDQYTDKFLAVGEEARRMLGRTPGNIIAIRPLKMELYLIMKLLKEC